ncbi:MAG: 2-C-methyl-D-erythritol 4-phosphate cytidylyltransferase, partial [Sphaerochaetaceae bacterium]
LDRSSLVAIQTPQAFRFPAILQAHLEALNSTKSYYDDTEIFTDFGLRVGVCEGRRENRKITTLQDIATEEG